MQEVDSSLIEQCQKRDERALSLLYRHCYSMMKGIAMRYLFDKSYCEDVVNAGFLKIVNGLDKYDRGQPFKPWASTIMIRVALDHIRKIMRGTDRRTDLYEDMATVDKQSHAMNIADQQFDAEELLGLLEVLPPQTKVVFNMFAIDGYSHKEIADQLSISQGTSKWHVSKARERLQKDMMNIQLKNKENYEPSHR